MKTEVRKQEWTPGLWKILDAVAKEMKKMEAESFDKDEDVYSDPECLLQDPLTGSAVYFSPNHDNDAGKTHGRGYRRCPAVKQRIPHKVPPGLTNAILIDMIIKMLVPDDAPEEQRGPLAKAAYNRVAAALLEGQENTISTNKELAAHWKKEYARHQKATESLIQEMKDMTWTTRAGDSALNIKANVLAFAETDRDAMLEIAERSKVIIEEEVTA